MAEARSKLQIVGGSPEEARELRDRLGTGYEVGIVPESALGTHQAELLLRSIGEGVCLATADGTIVWANDFYQGLDDHAKAQVADSCRQAAAYMSERLAQPGPPPGSLACKFEIASEGDTNLYDVYVTAVSACSVDRSTGEIAAVVRDVSVARRTQQKMDAIDRAGYELARFDIEQIQKMNAMERLELLEKKIVRYTKQLLSYDHFAIFLLDRQGKLELVISQGLPQEISDLDLYREVEGSGISGYVAATGKSYICRNVGADERFLPGLVGARSSLTVPLRVHDKIIGVLDIESSKPEQFDDMDRQFVEIFARHIAMALHMLNLLVAERSTTSGTVSHRVEDEIAEPLQDILQEVDWLKNKPHDPEVDQHISRILTDVESIRKRMKDVAEGPQTLLGVERALAKREKDPLLLGKRVLVADDQAKIRKIIGEILSHRGCEVTVCVNGSEAVNTLAETAAGGRPPFDLVISDIQMPDRNGYEVFSAAQKTHDAVPVILMTGFGYDPHHSIVRASQEGLQSVLFKPFEIEMLMEQVRRAFEPSTANK